MFQILDVCIIQFICDLYVFAFIYLLQINKDKPCVSEVWEEKESDAESEILETSSPILSQNKKISAKKPTKPKYSDLNKQSSSSKGLGPIVEPSTSGLQDIGNRNDDHNQENNESSDDDSSLMAEYKRMARSKLTALKPLNNLDNAPLYDRINDTDSNITNLVSFNIFTFHMIFLETFGF